MRFSVCAAAAYLATAAVLASAAMEEETKSFFSQLNLAPSSRSVFSAEKSFGVYIEAHDNTRLPLSPVLAARNEADSYLAQAADIAAVFWEITSPSTTKTTSAQWAYDEKAGLTQITGGLENKVHQVFVEDEKNRFQAELALVQRLVGSIEPSKAGLKLIVWRLAAGELDKAALNALANQVRNANGGIVTLNVAAPLSAAEVQRERRLQGVNAAKGFSGPEYVLMSWVLIALVSIAFFVFCCIPWAPELDAGLRSSLKSKSD